MRVDVVGAICAGLVWGCLSSHVYRPSTQSARSLTVLLVIISSGAVQHWLQSNVQGASIFIAATLIGAVGHHAWIKGLQRRDVVASP